ncbi:hypothetical protein J6590_101275 [Homalodisca vitripennis]|nr:hypothetical protein J6590_101275 [Homalodisca vitripennis]
MTKSFLLIGLYHPVELTLGTGQTDLCYIMDVQERHITNRKFQNSGALVFVPKEPMDLANLDKGVPPITCFEWRGWLRAGFPFSR